MGAKKKAPVPHPVGARARELRQRRGLTQEEAARRSGVLDRTELVRIEKGENRASTERVLSGLAMAYSVPQLALTAYLRGERTLDDLIAGATDEPGYTRAGNVEAAIAYHEGRWHMATIAAARAVALTRSPDPSPKEWAEILDRIEKCLKNEKILLA
jgi:transcriptional regulator with XRE-family HTH domain